MLQRHEIVLNQNGCNQRQRQFLDASPTLGHAVGKLLSGNVWLCRYFQSISRLIEANLREETEMLQLMFEIIERHRRGNSQNRMKNWNLVTEVLV